MSAFSATQRTSSDATRPRGLPEAHRVVGGSGRHVLQQCSHSVVSARPLPHTPYTLHAPRVASQSPPSCRSPHGASHGVAQALHTSGQRGSGEMRSSHAGTLPITWVAQASSLPLAALAPRYPGPDRRHPWQYTALTPSRRGDWTRSPAGVLQRWQD